MTHSLAYIAYQVIDTHKTDDNGKPIAYWNRIGAAFTNKDGSLSVVLNAYPCDGRLQLRIPKPRNDDPVLEEQAGIPEDWNNDDIPF